jgi:hypothetical protein
MKPPKLNEQPDQQRMKESAKNAKRSEKGLQPNDIAEKTVMKRQGKNMHDQSGK